LNAADPLGVRISGVTPGDTLELVSAVGLASFEEDSENEGISSLIGIVAAGAQVTATAFGAPEATPVIQAGAEFAKDRFKERSVRRRFETRTAWTRARSTRPARRAVSSYASQRHTASTTAARTRSSGSSHRAPDRRQRPEHLHGNAYFIRRGMGATRSREGGDLFVVAWDYIFSDNAGSTNYT
jgi:hypothetical protein